MPLPKPKPGEDESKFISRCVSFVFNEGTLRGKPMNPNSAADRKRATAACYTTWRSKSYDEMQKCINELKSGLDDIKNNAFEK